MDDKRLPSQLGSLVPLLSRWAIGDDMIRSREVEKASRHDLEALVAAVDSVDQDVLYGWLAGPEANSPTPSAGYVAVTCLTMAADEARISLRQGSS